MWNRMKAAFGRHGFADNPEWPEEPPARSGYGGWIEGLGGVGQWDELAAEVGQESQARAALVGLPGVGKSLLFNRLRGWDVSRPDDGALAGDGLRLEFYGAFLLADLPVEAEPDGLLNGDILLALGDPALVLYLVDAGRGVQAADFRWVSRLRAAGRPLLVALNKCDQVHDVAAVLQDAEHRLGMPVIPISAETGENVEERLLPAMLGASPRLAVPLGREIATLRRLAARRIVNQAALLTGILSAQPLPVLDLPFQAMVQCGVVMRVGAAYGRAPAGGINRALLGTVASSLSLNYLAQTVAKLVPLLGWVVSGLLGAGATLLIGEAAIRYYESGGTVPLHVRLPRPAVRQRVHRAARSLRRRLPRRRPPEEQEIPIEEEA